MELKGACVSLWRPTCSLYGDTHDEATCRPKMWWPHTAASRRIELLMSPKTPRSAGVAGSRARLLCRRAIDPPAVAGSPVVAIVGLSSTCSLTYSGVFAWGHGSLLSHGCSIDGFVRPDYLRPLSHADIRLGVINAHAALFDQDHQSIPAFTGTGCIWCDNVNKKCDHRYDKSSALMVAFLSQWTSFHLFAVSHEFLRLIWWKFTIICLWMKLWLVKNGAFEAFVVPECSWLTSHAVFFCCFLAGTEKEATIYTYIVWHVICKI